MVIYGSWMFMAKPWLSMGITDESHHPIPTGLDGRLRPAAPVAALGDDRRCGPGRCGGARRQRVGGVATGGRGCRDVILGPKIGGKPKFHLVLLGWFGEWFGGMVFEWNTRMDQRPWFAIGTMNIQKSHFSWGKQMDTMVLSFDPYPWKMITDDYETWHTIWWNIIY